METCPNCGASGAETIQQDLCFCPVCQRYFYPSAVAGGLGTTLVRQRLIRALKGAKTKPEQELAAVEKRIRAAEERIQHIEHTARVFRASRMEEVADAMAPDQARAEALRAVLHRMNAELFELTSSGD